MVVAFPFPFSFFSFTLFFCFSEVFFFLLPPERPSTVGGGQVEHPKNLRQTPIKLKT